ncbi:hypothetical protein J14TS2_20600 [Bacillus sp. J14TS2]|uniref:hypothetical protein n=1 Tax=Bacillus sp. J14TS2 TaxID=2807188 RepID=UPI001AFDEF55|nr:hypothetical protein [Bacillus sp. J14TS2]GIN71585.1 hypothetical protein J14TS2_20600 [Bacillus sp. J14TS2]
MEIRTNNVISVIQSYLPSLTKAAGTSGITALNAKNRFSRIGQDIEAVIDPHPNQ